MDQEVDLRIHQLDSRYSLDLYTNFHRFLDEIPELNDKKDFFLKGDYSLEKITNALRYPRIKVYGAVLQNRLIGFIWGSSSYAGLGFVSWLWVDPSHRNKGISKTLLNSYEKYIVDEGGHVVELYCFPNLEKFYEKLGYKTIGRREKGYFQLPQLIMEKLI